VSSGDKLGYSRVRSRSDKLLAFFMWNPAAFGACEEVVEQVRKLAAEVVTLKAQQTECSERPMELTSQLNEARARP
jgi:hypothetical protein